MITGKGDENDLNNLARFTLFSALHMLCLQIYFFHYDSAVMLEDLSNLSNFTFFMSRYYFHCVSNFNMHFVQDWKTVRLAFLSLPSFKLPDEEQEILHKKEQTTNDYSSTFSNLISLLIIVPSHY